jgi:TIR domain
MQQLAESPIITGFFSYSREDDQDSNGALTALRNRIRRELRAQLGRTASELKLFQDTVAIPHGSMWEDQIRAGISQSVFFIPIITPTAVRSSQCKKEFAMFRERESELGREDLIFPILYIRVAPLANEVKRGQDEVLEIIHDRQYADWTLLRQREVESFEFRVKIEQFCGDICDALLKEWLSPEEFRLQTRRRAPEARSHLEVQQRGGPQKPESALRKKRS